MLAHRRHTRTRVRTCVWTQAEQTNGAQLLPGHSAHLSLPRPRLKVLRSCDCRGVWSGGHQQREKRRGRRKINVPSPEETAASGTSPESNGGARPPQTSEDTKSVTFRPPRLLLTYPGAPGRYERQQGDRPKSSVTWSSVSDLQIS